MTAKIRTPAGQRRPLGVARIQGAGSENSKNSENKNRTSTKQCSKEDRSSGNDHVPNSSRTTGAFYPDASFASVLSHFDFGILCFCIKSVTF